MPRGIPEPKADVDALFKSVQALKEQVEILTGVRNSSNEKVVSVADFAAAATFAELRDRLTGFSTPDSQNAHPDWATTESVDDALIPLQNDVAALQANTVTGSGGLAGGGALTTNPQLTLAAIDSLRLLANLTGGSASPSAQSLSAILDAIIGSSAGSMLRRGASSWEALAPGSNGNFLRMGASAPEWADGDPVLLETITATSGTSKTTTASFAGYREIMIVGENISASGVASPHLQMAFSTDGSSFTTAGSVISGFATGSNEHYFVARLMYPHGPQSVKNCHTQVFAEVVGSGAGAGTSGYMAAIGDVNYVRFTWGGGESFDGVDGSFKVYGIG